MENYTPTRVGHHCAAMVRYRPDAADSNRIEIYPIAQWGDIGVDYTGPENFAADSARRLLRERQK